MKLNFALIISIVIAVGLVAFGFTFYQISTERAKLNNELEARTAQIADEFSQGSLALVNQSARAKKVQVLDSITNKYDLIGIAVYFQNDSIIGNAEVTGLVQQSQDHITEAIAADLPQGNFIDANAAQVFQYIRPILLDGIPNSAVVVYAHTEYIDNIIGGIWLRNFFRWFIQALLVSFITVLVIRWRIFNPINKISEWVKAARSGSLEQLKEQPPASFLAPLHKEIVHIAKAMHDAKAIAEEEARLRTNAEAIWTPERLKIEMETLLQNRKMVVVSNREPYMHMHEGKAIKCIVPASGLITAMEPILKSCGGLWIASGSGDADKETVDKNDRLPVPPDDPKYTLRRLWLTQEQEDHFYYGFSNEGLWPLCHIAHTRPVFRTEDWHHYKVVNERFAEAVLLETAGEDDPFILIQDYHFALLPELIKKQKPNAKIAIFWHIPWPNPESFGICPWQKEILRGMLGADLIGFHTQYHCNHFLETVNNSLESRVQWETFSVKIAGRNTLVKPFPISIEFTLKDYDRATDTLPTPSKLLEEHGINAEYLGIGVDRIDYTKGIVEKFLAIERFLEKNPQYIGKFTFVQIGAPSRTLLKSYSDTVSAVENEAERINWRFKSKNWKAILLLKKHHSHQEIAPFYASANLCMVTSLHDGMNLVAKEFVAARVNNDGVLILSRFAGASHELRGACIVNPYDIDKTADAIKAALEMGVEEQAHRMRQMRQVILGNNIYGWAADLIKTMVNIQK
jgi:trehalose-6-phosphate synthase